MTQTVEKIQSITHFEQFRKFAGRTAALGAKVWIFDTAAKLLHCLPADNCTGDSDRMAEYARSVFEQADGSVLRLGPDGLILAAVVKENDQPVAAVLIDVCSLSARENAENKQQHDILPQSHTLWAVRADSTAAYFFGEMLSLFVDEYRSASVSAHQLELVSTELAQTYEELVLLYNLSTNMNLTKSNATYLQMACDQLTQIVFVEGIAIFLEKTVDREKRLVLTAGSGLVPIDQLGADIMMNHLAEELNSGREALLDSDIDRPFRYNWPERIRNIIAVPLRSNNKISGFMVATNIANKPDFDSVDVKLFNFVASQCAVFIENDRLFTDLKDLFIGSLKALTSSIDAKDQYTRGHSERVAFISRWIAEQLAGEMDISEDQIHRIYLAGLLHDIGKIGISEAVLQKKGRLDDDELKKIKAHPCIGATILSEIRQMKDIVPGVLYHHERIDGTGYPSGLKGDEIPLIGKIISLADAFDAMTSKRVYREALSISRAVVQIRQNLGMQFDQQVGLAFIESDLQKLWSIIQDGFIESWDYSNFSEYGLKAVGALVR